jgi:hypothetical protein
MTEPKIVNKVELNFIVRQNKSSGTWDVLGPNGYYRCFRYKDEAEFFAAAMAGEEKNASESRVRLLLHLGMIEEKSA